MAELTPPPDSSPLMRHLTLAATAYVAGTQVLYCLTKGAMASPDRWENLYLALMVAYATAPEVKVLAHAKAEAPDSWNEKIRKGGPVMAFWVSLFLAIGTLRLWNVSYPMPPEIESITLKTIGIFFGTYALRQYRRGRAKKAIAAEMEVAPEASLDGTLLAQIPEALRIKPQGLRTLSKTLDVPPRTLARYLRKLTQDGTLVRDGQSPTDPQAVYRAV